MRGLKVIGIVVLAIVVGAVVSLGAFLWSERQTTTHAQAELETFYTPPNPLPVGKPGDIIRSEMMPNVALDGATGYRVLYLTENVHKEPVASSAMLFVPNAKVKAGSRKVVAWAHPTVGMGDECAPSRVAEPMKTLTWVQGMINQGWIVTATDYAGLGTPGIEYYLVGKSEAMDVINSVRMAQRFPDSGAGSAYAVYGHSQGGHSSLWTGEISSQYAPELKLVGVAGAAPAAEMVPLVDQQWDTVIGWVIGPEAMVSWPATYPKVTPQQVGSEAGIKRYEAVARDCLIEAGITGTVEEQLGSSVFRMDPADDPAWRGAASDQTPQPLPKAVPALVIQSVNDGVVIPNTTSLLQQKWCAAGSDLQVDWLGPLSPKPTETHTLTGSVGGPLATDWIQDRFAGRPAPNSCSQTPAVAPFTPKKA